MQILRGFPRRFLYLVEHQGFLIREQKSPGRGPGLFRAAERCYFFAGVDWPERTDRLAELCERAMVRPMEVSMKTMAA